MGAHVLIDRLDGERLKPFLDAVRASGFTGDIATDEASRTVHATDNSIYQRKPAAVLFPRDGADVERAVRAAALHSVPVTARGGGTGTNGQSLTSGVIVDCSRHMNRILSFDKAAGTVTVEPGVVLDQLNAFLKPHGLFFPPTVSTASRATIGGMIATDASGKGSRIYGRTSDYLEALDVVLADGSTGLVRTEDAAGLQRLAAQGGRLAVAAGAVLAAVDRHRAEIEAVFPKMNRGLTGYNLLDVKGADGLFRLQKLLAGSEGTLAFTRAATLRVIPRPAFRALAVVRYGSFNAALDDVARLVDADPAAIEIMDDKVLRLAQEDVVWASLEKVLGGATARPVAGLNVVEFVGDTAEEVEAALERMAALAVPAESEILDQITVRDQALVATVWDLRKKAVGLLGRLGGIPFIEDTAVPPESLPAYVREFRALLDAHGLDYGMFGHADVGCLHVRPVLDMRNPDHAALIRPLSDAVADLTRRYGGLLWGEHGRGVRGEYSPLFFGPHLYPVLSKIKAAFDPHNLFNPGKLAVPFEGGAVDRIDGVPFRGAFDRQLDATHAERYGKAVACNGNGACHGWDAFDLMCPSYKATRDRNQSPKGRAALLREWARQKSVGEADTPAFAAFEDEVKAALDTCLSCKACASLCPVKVDIPAMRADFFASYYERRRRPARHRALGLLEAGLIAARRVPVLARLVSRSKFVAALAERAFGLVDLPAYHAARRPSGPAGPAGGRPVVLLEDLFNASFDGAALEAAEALLAALGYRVTRQAARRNGKALQVLGFAAPFRRIAEARLAEIEALSKAGAPILAIDAATGLMFAEDYAKAAGRKSAVPVLSLEQFLAAELDAGHLKPLPAAAGGNLTLLTHCTERAARPLTPKLWDRVFSAFGLTLQTPATGCCGMAGMFGHEKEHKSLSETLFRMSWKPILDRAEPKAVLASGFSCRCQTERFGGFRPRHPAEALLEAISGAAGLRARTVQTQVIPMLNDPRSHGLWEKTAPPAPETRPLQGDVTADVVIVGGGYTGLSAALHLAEEGTRVVLLEAKEIGFGGAGRNVGLINAGMWVMPDDLPGELGAVHGERLLDLLGNGPRVVMNLIDKHGIACELERNGTLHCAVGDAGLKEIEARAAQWQKRGAPVSLLSQEETARRVGTTAYRGALLDMRAGTLQPLAYARGLAHAAIRAGAVLHTSSPVVAQVETASGWTVKTDKGTVTASWLIVATDAYSEGPFAAVRNEQVHLPYFNFATVPLGDNIRRTILPGREGAWDTKEILSSFRMDQAGRLVFGSVGALRGAGTSIHRDWARRSLKKLFPEIADIPFETEWYGKIGMTDNALPRLHQFGRQAIGFSGYNGRGISPGTVFGKVLAEHILGRMPVEAMPLPSTDIATPSFRTAKEAWYETGAAVAHLAGARL